VRNCKKNFHNKKSQWHHNRVTDKLWFYCKIIKMFQYYYYLLTLMIKYIL